MNQRTALLAAVAVIAAAVGPFVGLAAADVTLTVTVKTAAGGPVRDVDLTARVDGEIVDTATTASNGKAFLDVPEGANVSIEVDHNVYVRNSPFRVTNAGEEEVTVTVWEKATAEVTVTDAEGSVEGVRVVFRKNGDIVRIRSTDATGTVSSGVIESGEYTLTFFEPGYLRKAVTLTVEDDTQSSITIERGSVTVEFRVLDDTFDPPKPIGNAVISGDTIGSVPTQPDGQRAVSVPVNTELDVTVEKEGYRPISATVVVREADRSINLTTQRTPTVNVAVANERVVVGESVEVTVTDEYGEPLPEATVFLDGSPVGQPDESGSLRVRIEAAGEHTVFAAAEGLSSERLTVTGVEAGSDGSPAAETTTSDDGDDGGSGPTDGTLNLRSTAIGIAAGFVLAAILFVFLRFR